MPAIYTIGYATKPLETFIAQLQQYGIDVVADIRSVPYSKAFHDFHKEAIARHLKQHNIRYVYLGDELGPRSKDPAHYDHSGQVQYDRLMQSPLFLEGATRLQQGLEKGYTIALMCAEKDPATCHRSLLVGYFIAHCGLSGLQSPVEVLHIQHDGHIEDQQRLEQRLVITHGLEDDLFMSAGERQKQAYDCQLKGTSYRKETLFSTENK